MGVVHRHEEQVRRLFPDFPLLAGLYPGHVAQGGQVEAQVVLGLFFEVRHDLSVLVDQLVASGLAVGGLPYEILALVWLKLPGLGGPDYRGWERVSALLVVVLELLDWQVVQGR